MLYSLYFAQQNEKLFCNIAAGICVTYILYYIHISSNISCVFATKKVDNNREKKISNHGMTFYAWVDDDDENEAQKINEKKVNKIKWEPTATNNGIQKNDEKN